MTWKEKALQTFDGMENVNAVIDWIEENYLVIEREEPEKCHQCGAPIHPIMGAQCMSDSCPTNKRYYDRH